jgi:hypothetical protein
MTVYFLLSVASGPVIYIDVDPAPLGLAGSHLGWLLTAFFAWRVCRGGRISRALLIIGTVFLCLSVAIAAVHRLTPAPLGVFTAAGVQLAVLVSPAIYWRTRPLGWTGRPSRPVRTRRRGPRWLVVALACVAALGLTGTAVAVAVIEGRNASYDSRTVDVRFGQPAYATLTPGSYFLFVRCAYGCEALSLDQTGAAWAGSINPNQLSVEGTSNIVVANISSSGELEMRGEADRPFEPDLVFRIPATQRVRISLDKRLRQPAFIAPSEQKSRYLLHWIEVAVAFGLLLLAALAALAWVLPWRPKLPLGLRW